MKTIYIIKIGGNIIDDEKKLNKFINELCSIKEDKILVHGGGKLATQLSEKLGIQTKMVDGRRITDGETLKIATMVYAGWINKSIVAKLNSKKQNAIGLCGADLQLIISDKRKKGKIDYGFVGDINQKKVKGNILQDLLLMHSLPVIAPITVTEKGQLLNTNADSIASSLAIALSKFATTKLIFCFEKKGVLYKEKVIKSINKKIYSDLINKKIINDGMIPKLDNAFHAIEEGVSEVIIGDALSLKKLIQSKNGTSIRLH